jgi:hypothetical protein
MIDVLFLLFLPNILTLKLDLFLPLYFLLYEDLLHDYHHIKRKECPT